MTRITWEHSEQGVWFGYTEKSDWVNISCPIGGHITAFVQPFKSRCHTGCFETVEKAKAWARKILIVSHCPSTHCERRGECASPHECMIKER